VLFRSAFEKLNLRPFVRLLADLTPDWALCTHFLPAGIIAWLRRKHRLALPQAVVVTDFDVHAFWLLQDVEHYFVAREEAKVYLERAGVPSDRISVTGIPIHPVFGTPRDKSAMRRLHGLDEDLPTFLLSVGGFSAWTSPRGSWRAFWLCERPSRSWLWRGRVPACAPAWSASRPRRPAPTRSACSALPPPWMS